MVIEAGLSLYLMLISGAIAALCILRLLLNSGLEDGVRRLLRVEERFQESSRSNHLGSVFT